MNDQSDEIPHPINFSDYCNSDYSSLQSPSNLQMFTANEKLNIFSPSPNQDLYTPVSSPLILKNIQTPSPMYTPFISLNSVEEIVPILQSLIHGESNQ